MPAAPRTVPARDRRADVLRFLAADAVQAANSGHPGAPLGMAEMAVALWHRHLRHDPAAPDWPDRDRFVLSNGHASMLLYALLHLSGYDLPLDELRRFRQLGSRTPGHPEVGHTPGVETTTGPLGQGLGNAVGMALGEALLAREFNRDGHVIVDHHTYVFLGDGCLMEGISHEACSLAGALGLGKLICLYDDNGISIDGEVGPWFADDTPRRFAAYGWHVVADVDGHDVDAVDRAIAAAKARGDAPSLICCRTEIGHGAPGKAGGHDVHGAPLGAETLQAMRSALGWTAAPFEVPESSYRDWNAGDLGAARRAAWQARMDAYAAAYPEAAAEFARRSRGALPAGFDTWFAAALTALQAEAPAVASRKASQQALDLIAPRLPELLGGSADLTGSNLTAFSGVRPVRRGFAEAGRHVNYGVREFGMGAVLNGLALHGGHLPYGGTFLTFSDYSRNAIRMAALMGVRSVFVLTHDSIGLGEDGPTHQPVEHLASLRLVPGVHVHRPCDAVETLAAWGAAVRRADGPSCLVLSRQTLPAQARDAGQLAAIARGGYVLAEAAGDRPEVAIVATGSEVALAMAARDALAAEGLAVRVVSMPCVELFDAQPQAWRAAVLPPGVPRLVVEAGATGGWWRLAGAGGQVLGIDRFGASGPAEALFEAFGLTARDVAAAARRLTRPEAAPAHP
ncbi:transketolase [Coralloluteibacterium stylophorae]|uniref:Transketolase n=2 Tax=Coralloluteibacterium stylophorae TaxID=1776034 RepID=A0AAP2CA31_9GAMM|nr:transketolase [Coralloluteibacterium stylophorae]MBS7456604.1 transketolase [Coralloluteibacterium stylophorae]